MPFETLDEPTSLGGEKGFVDGGRLFGVEIVPKQHFFFFQAEDGIRDYKETGVQTCALPIFQKYAGRERNPGLASPWVAVEPAMLRTEQPVQEIVRRIAVDGIADGLHLSEEA